MSLPPLANILAVHRADPASLDEIAIDLEASGEFAQVWRPARGWVAASAPLPGGLPDSAAVRASGFAFAEGRDLLAAGDAREETHTLGEIADLADRAPDRLGSLAGDFAFIRFRPDGEGTVVRSCGGLVPMYLWQSGPNLAVSTRLGDLVRYLPEELPIDRLVNAIWTTGICFFPDQRTFLAGTSMLDRGHAAVLSPHRSAVLHRYWQPRPRWVPRPTPARSAERSLRLRTLLIDKLRRDLAPEGGNLLTLSGGVDSTSLAALAAGAAGRPVWTWSLLPGQEDLLQREMSYIGPLVKRFGIERSWSVHVQSAMTSLDLLRQAPPVACHVIHPALCALPGIVREAPVRVLFGGEFADEICGSGGTTPDWAAHTSLFRLVSSLGRLPSGPRDVVRWAKHRALRVLGKPRLPFPSALGDLVRPELRHEYHAWFGRRQADAARDHLDRRYLALCGEIGGFVTMNWEATSVLGVRRAFPFFNREVFELAFECHPDELVGPGSKKLLRAALRDDVPTRNLQRRDKGAWGAGYRGKVDWHDPLPEALSGVLREDWYPRPPVRVEGYEARGLRQLAQFVDAVGVRRRARLEPKPSPGFVSASVISHKELP
jgi:asparagine synthetase B (glutamine-hydrolysing)